RQGREQAQGWVMARTGPFRIAIVPGVNPGKWTKLWVERRRDLPLEVVPVAEAGQLAAFTTERVDMLFARLPIEADSLHTIRLYDEAAVVVAGRDHPISLVDSVTVAELSDETVLSEPLSETVDLIVAGGGIALVPQSVARQFSRKDLV